MPSDQRYPLASKSSTVQAGPESCQICSTFSNHTLQILELLEILEAESSMVSLAHARRVALDTVQALHLTHHRETMACKAHPSLVHEVRHPGRE